MAARLRSIGAYFREAATELVGDYRRVAGEAAKYATENPVRTVRNVGATVGLFALYSVRTAPPRRSR